MRSPPTTGRRGLDWASLCRGGEESIKARVLRLLRSSLRPFRWTRRKAVPARQSHRGVAVSCELAVKWRRLSVWNTVSSLHGKVQTKVEKQLSTVDPSARASMKNAANCDT